METLEFYITHASRQLNDQRRNRAFTRWGRGLLLDYLNLGLKEIGIYKPDAFTKSIDLALVPGEVQTVSDEISLLSIDANADGSKINIADIDLVKSYGAYAVCAPKIKIKDGRPIIKIMSVSIDKDNPRTFYVSPPVPTGMSLSVRATIIDSPPKYTLTDWTKNVKIESKYTNALIQFMMAKAYELNREVSPQDRANSLQYYQMFYDGLGVKRKIEDRFKAGYHSGKMGTGDPQAGRI